MLRQHQRRAVDRIMSSAALNRRSGAGSSGTLKGPARRSRCSPPHGSSWNAKDEFQNPTVVVVVDRTELEGQLKGWVGAAAW